MTSSSGSSSSSSSDSSSFTSLIASSGSTLFSSSPSNCSSPSTPTSSSSSLSETSVVLLPSSHDYGMREQKTHQQRKQQPFIRQVNLPSPSEYLKYKERNDDEEEMDSSHINSIMTMPFSFSSSSTSSDEMSSCLSTLESCIGNDSPPLSLPYHHLDHHERHYHHDLAKETNQVSTSHQLHQPLLHHHHQQQQHDPQQQVAVPQPKYIDHVIMEIVETERAYVRDLHEIIEGYLKHMQSSSQLEVNNLCNNRNRGDSISSVSSLNPPIQDLTPEVMTALFGNLEDVYQFSSHFLSQLDTCHLDPVSIAQTFVANSSEFDVYTQYCTVHYPNTLKMLSDLMNRPQASQLFRERQLSLGHCLPLGAYLLKPVQRILKYPLLLQNIVKHCEETKEGEKMEGYESIKEALTVMTDYASYINDMKRKHEHQVRVQEVQSLLHGWQGHDLTTYGELLCESPFRMFGDRGGRYLFLFERMLLISKKKAEGNFFTYKAHIACSNLMLIESIPGQPLCFNVIPFDNPRVQYTFESKNIDEKRKWCLLLKKVILDNYHAVIPIQAKQALLELGQDSPCTTSRERSKSSSVVSHSSSTLPLSLDKVTPGHLILRRKLSAPEYLEKRHQRAKSPRSRSNTQPEIKEVPSRKAVDMIHASLHKGFRLRKSLRRMYSADYSTQRRSQTRSQFYTGMHENTSNMPIEESNDVSQLEGSSSPEEVIVKMRRRKNTNSTKDGNEEDEGFLSISNRNSIISIDGRNDPSDILNVCPPPQTFIPKICKAPAERLEEEEDIDDSSSVVEEIDRFTRGGRLRSSCMLSRKTSSLSGKTVDSGVGGEGGSRRNLCTPLSSGSSSLSMASSNLSSDTDSSSYYSGCNQAYVNYYFGPMLRRVQSFHHHNNNNNNNSSSTVNAGNDNCRSKSTLRQLTHTESFKHTNTAESRWRLRTPKKTLSISATKIALSAKSLRNLEQELSLSSLASVLRSQTFVDPTTSDACVNHLSEGISNLRMIDDDNDHQDVD